MTTSACSDIGCLHPNIRYDMQHTCWTCRPHSGRAHRSCLLVLRPSGVSVLLCDGFDALPGSPTMQSLGNVEFCSPPAAEKVPVDPGGSAIIAIAADIASKGDRAYSGRTACADWQRHVCCNSKLDHGEEKLDGGSGKG
jgi:hypothetical protein